MVHLNDEGTAMSDAVTLARLEGKMDVFNERQQTMTQNWTLANTRLNTHSERITAIEQTLVGTAGEKKGVSAVVRVLWAILGVLFTGGFLTVGTFIAWVSGAFSHG